MQNLNHPIVKQSFTIIDQVVGKHHLTNLEYAIARRVIHTTADFEFLNLLKFSPEAIDMGINYLREQKPIITDVSMVREGIKSMVSKTFNNPIVVAIEQVSAADKGKTKTETGLLKCCQKYPQALYVIGNAPTALLKLCQEILHNNVKPSLVIGVPVGFVSVLEAKKVLANLTTISQIRVEGNKGGSTVAAAIINALLILAKSNE